MNSSLVERQEVSQTNAAILYELYYKLVALDDNIIICSLYLQDPSEKFVEDEETSIRWNLVHQPWHTSS